MLNTSRSASSTFVLDWSLYEAGGSETPKSVERYNVTSNTWTAMADMLEGHQNSCAVTIGSVATTEEPLRHPHR
jgi:hypothetical protein